MAEVSDHIRALADAIQVCAQAGEERPVVLTEAVVLYEVMAYEDDGEVSRRLAYTVPTDNFSLSGALGLISAGEFYLRRDILHDEDTD